MPRSVSRARVPSSMADGLCTRCNISPCAGRFSAVRAQSHSAVGLACVAALRSGQRGVAAPVLSSTRTGSRDCCSGPDATSALPNVLSSLYGPCAGAVTCSLPLAESAAVLQQLAHPSHTTPPPPLPRQNCRGGGTRWQSAPPTTNVTWTGTTSGPGDWRGRAEWWRQQQLQERGRMGGAQQQQQQHTGRAEWFQQLHH
jgi:hypothetical protein